MYYICIYIYRDIHIYTYTFPRGMTNLHVTPWSLSAHDPAVPFQMHELIKFPNRHH